MNAAVDRLILTGGHLDDGRAVCLVLEAGRIVALHAEASLLPDASARVIAIDGLLLLPGLVDSHVHLDKTLLGHEWVAYGGGTSVQTRVANEKRLRCTLDWDVDRHADALLQRAIGLGTTALRSHVDIDEVTSLANVHAVLEVRHRWSDQIAIQLVAFPQSGILRCDGVAGLMDEALRLGVDVVGGLDPIGFDGDLDGHLDIVFGLAERHGKPVDIHLHDGGEAGLATLRAIAERTVALGLQGQVVVSHALALGDASVDAFAATADALARADVSIISSIPGDRPIPPLARLAEAGVNVALGSDNVRDAWSPMAVVSMLERAMLAAYRSGYRSDAQLRACLNLTTVAGRRALNLPANALQPGDPADVIAVAAPNAAAAVADRAIPAVVVRAGRVVADRRADSSGRRADGAAPGADSADRLHPRRLP